VKEEEVNTFLYRPSPESNAYLLSFPTLIPLSYILLKPLTLLYGIPPFSHYYGQLPVWDNPIFIPDLHLTPLTRCSHTLSISGGLLIIAPA
jgi:hypothetical protein